MEEFRISKFQILQDLEQNEFSAVYHARDSKTGLDGVLRIIPNANLQDLTFFARFDRENQLLNLISHPAILPVYEIGQEEGALYIFSRHVSGGTLADRLSDSPLQLDEVLKTIRELADALDALHGIGLVHRDLRPENIQFDDSGAVFLANCGMYKLSEACLPPSYRTLLGAPNYLSPEQARGENELETRSDIYTFGILLFQMLTGRLPYQANSRLGLAVQHLVAPIPSACALNPQLPIGVDIVLSKALAKDPAARFSNAREIVQALEQLEQGLELEIPAVPPSDQIDSQHWQSISSPSVPAEAEIEGQPVPQYRPKRRKAFRITGTLIALALISGCVYLGFRTGIASNYFRGLGEKYVMEFANELADQLIASPIAEISTAFAETQSVPASITSDLNQVPAQTQSRLGLTPTLGPDSTATFVPTVVPTMVPTITSIPTTTPTSGPSPTPLPLSYTIQYNDTLFTIASQFHIDLGYLIGNNNLTCSSRLYPGKDLLLPPPGIAADVLPQVQINQYSAPDLEPLRVLDCTKEVSDLAFSPDGTILASAVGNFVYLWEAGSWVPLRRLKGSQSFITAIEFSPDGSTIAAGSDDNTVRLWDVKTGDEITALKGHRRAITDVAFSPDGLKLVSTSLDQTFKIWDVETHNLLTDGRGYATHSAAFDASGEFLAVGYIDFLRLYDAGGDNLLQEIPTDDVVRNLRFSPDGLLLGSSTFIWQFLDGQIEQLVYRFESSGHKTSFSQDGSLFFVGRDLWLISNGNLERKLESPIPETPTTTYAWESIALSSDGKMVAWGTQDGLFVLGVPRSKAYGPALDDVFYTVGLGDNFYNIASANNIRLSTFLDHNGLTCDNQPFIGQNLRIPPGMDYNQIETRLANLAVINDVNTGDIDPIHTMDIRCADALGPIGLNSNGFGLSSGAAIWQTIRESILVKFNVLVVQEEDDPYLPRLGGTKHVVFSPDGLLAAVRSGKTVNLWGVDDGRLKLTLEGHTDNVTSLAFSPDRTYLASSGNVGEGVIRIWRVSDGSLETTLEGFSAQWMAFSPDGELLITLAGDTARIWRVSDGTLYQTTKGVLGDLKISPDGQWLAYIACTQQSGSRCINQVVNLYRIEGGTVANTFLGVKPTIQDIAFSPNGAYLVGASGDTAVVWEINTGTILYKLRSPAETVNKVLFVPNSSVLATLTDKNILRYWKIDNETSPHRVFLEPVEDITFSADGRVMATLFGNTITVWGVVP